MKKEEKIPVKETVAEMIKRIAKENNYEDVHLPETDLLGEDVAIVMRYDGLWSAQFSVGNSQAYFVYFDEKGELRKPLAVVCNITPKYLKTKNFRVSRIVGIEGPDDSLISNFYFFYQNINKKPKLKK